MVVERLPGAGFSEVDGPSESEPTTETSKKKSTRRVTGASVMRGLGYAGRERGSDMAAVNAEQARAFREAFRKLIEGEEHAEPEPKPSKKGVKKSSTSQEGSKRSEQQAAQPPAEQSEAVRTVESVHAERADDRENTAEDHVSDGKERIEKELDVKTWAEREIDLREDAIGGSEFIIELGSGRAVEDRVIPLPEENLEHKDDFDAGEAEVSTLDESLYPPLMPMPVVQDRGEYVPPSSPVEMIPPHELAGPIPEGEPVAPVVELADDVTHNANVALQPPRAQAVEAWDQTALYTQHAEQGAAASIGRVTAEEPMITKREHEDEVYYAAKQAKGQGAASGLVVGYLAARHRYRKKMKREHERYEKQAVRQDKELEKTRQDQRFYAANQEKREAETNQRLFATERRAAAAEAALRTRQAEKPAPNGGVLPEQRPNIPQHIPVAVEGVPDQVAIPKEHTLQGSAWLNTEVETKTGKVVENPTLARGHEYYRERAHETRAADQRNAAAGEVALVAAATHTDTNNASDPSTSGMLPNTYIPSATTQGSPTPPKAKQRAVRPQMSQAMSTGPTWPYVVALIGIVLCLAFLLS